MEQVHHKIMNEIAKNFNCSTDAISVEKLISEGKSGDIGKR